jgi:hypothetical protein
MLFYEQARVIMSDVLRSREKPTYLDFGSLSLERKVKAEEQIRGYKGLTVTMPMIWVIETIYVRTMPIWAGVTPFTPNTVLWQANCFQ